MPARTTVIVCGPVPATFGVKRPVELTPGPEYVPPVGVPTSWTAVPLTHSGPTPAKLTVGSAVTVMLVLALTVQPPEP